MSIADFSDARRRLRQFYRQGHEYRLDNMLKFMAFLGNPQNSLKIIHVAGTSGKTSTCYYAAALLKATGYKVGLTVSPHVDEVNERVQIGLQPLPEAEFCRALDEFLQLVEASNLPLSYFEVMAAFAYWYFEKVKVDYAVIEVGLGGRIDGTNVVDRRDKICVITDIGLDHTEILGDTLPKIAAEKAGIILDHNDVYTHEQAQEILDVFAKKCAETQATLHIVEPQQDETLSQLPLFQQRNFQLAKAAVEQALQRQEKTLNKLSIQEAIYVYIPARMEIRHVNGKTIIIDGAHNGQKLGKLLESIDEQFAGQNIAALIAFVSGDKRRMQQAIDTLVPHLQYCIVTEFTSEQDLPKASVPASTVTEYLRQIDYDRFEVVTNSTEALRVLLGRPEPLLLVTGSFYLLNHIRPHIIKV